MHSSTTSARPREPALSAYRAAALGRTIVPGNAPPRRSESGFPALSGAGSAAPRRVMVSRLARAFPTSTPIGPRPTRATRRRTRGVHRRRFYGMRRRLRTLPGRNPRSQIRNRTRPAEVGRGHEATVSDPRGDPGGGPRRRRRLRERLQEIGSGPRDASLDCVVLQHEHDSGGSSGSGLRGATGGYYIVFEAHEGQATSTYRYEVTRQQFIRFQDGDRVQLTLNNNILLNIQPNND